MRKLLLGLIVFALGLGASALVFSQGAGARNLVDGTLTGSVGTSGNHDAFAISLSASTVAAGTYQFNITDYSEIHNFDLCKGMSCTGSNSVATTAIEATGAVSWTLTLAPGTYYYQCDAHHQLHGTLTVTGGTTSTSTTSTAPVLRVTINSVLAKRKLVTVTATANRLAHVTGVLLQKTTQLVSTATDGKTVKLKLRPLVKLKPGYYFVQVTAQSGSTSVTKKKKFYVM